QEQVVVDVEDPGGVVGPFDVPPDPEERFRDSAQHCCCCCCCCCWAAIGPDGPRSGAADGRRRAPPQVRCRVDGLSGTSSPPARAQVSLEPPPWLELTTRLPRGRATRVSPPGATHTRCPSLTAKGRRSTWRGSSRSAQCVGAVDSRQTSWAMNARGSATTASRRRSIVASSAWGPITRPYPPDDATGFQTSSPIRLRASSRSSS